MKCLIILFAAATLTVPSLAQQKKTGQPSKTVTPITNPPVILKNTADSFSYALGMNIAKNLQFQSVEEVNFPAMQKAMEDVFKKRGETMNDEQANSVIQTVIQGNASKKSAAEKGRGVAFLAENKKRPGVITTASGLQYEVITKGDANSATPQLQDTVVAHYAGTLIDGKEFDNSYKRGEPLTIPVAGVIKGWTEALQLMHIGDKWKVYIPSELGYGDRGAGSDIPGGAALVFEMELLGIRAAGVKAETAPADNHRH